MLGIIRYLYGENDKGSVENDTDKHAVAPAVCLEEYAVSSTALFKRCHMHCHTPARHHEMLHGPRQSASLGALKLPRISLFG